MSLILSGFKNAGKSTLARLFALKHCHHLIDTDELIKQSYHQQHQTSLSTRDIYQQIGQTSFRALEAKHISLLKKTDNTIIALGGGTLLSEANVQHLKKIGTIVYLKLSAQTLYERLIQAGQLPAFISDKTPKQDFLALYQERSCLYEQTADRILDLEGQNQTQALEQLDRLYEHTHHTH